MMLAMPSEPKEYEYSNLKREDMQTETCSVGRKNALTTFSKN